MTWLILFAAIAGTAAAAFWLGYWVGSIDQARASLRCPVCLTDAQLDDAIRLLEQARDEIRQ